MDRLGPDCSGFMRNAVGIEEFDAYDYICELATTTQAWTRSTIE